MSAPVDMKAFREALSLLRMGPTTHEGAAFMDGVADILAQRDDLLEACHLVSACSPVQRQLDATDDETEITLTFCAADLKQIRAAVAKARAK